MPENKLHILVITTWFPSHERRGSSTISEPIDVLISKGHKVNVLMFQYFSFLSWLKKRLKGEPLSFWSKGKYVEAIPRDFVNFFPTRFSQNPVQAQKKAFLKYVHKSVTEYIAKNGKPQIIHHHGTSNYAYITAFISKEFNIPYVITEPSPLSATTQKHFTPYETTEDRISFIRNASARIALSSFYKKRYEELFGAAFIVVPNMVNETFTQIPLPKFPKVLSTFNFLAIGALSTVKRHDILIKAFAAAFKNNSAVHLSIAGMGQYEEQYRELIISLGMEKNIHLLGQKNKEEILELIDISHIQVVSSENETFCVAATEALFRGNPVLTTRCGGPEDYITTENGVTCEVNNVEDMQAKLLEIFNKYPSFNNALIATKAMENYSGDAVISQLEKVYLKVISPSYQAA